ncbi:MAG: alanine:cation symporter family protein [Streptococcus sp.]
MALTLSLVLFAFTTILGWSYYGERCFEFIFKSTKFLSLYRLHFCGYGCSWWLPHT